jgi:hypothetical protein
VRSVSAWDDWVPGLKPSRPRKRTKANDVSFSLHCHLFGSYLKLLLLAVYLWPNIQSQSIAHAYIHQVCDASHLRFLFDILNVDHGIDVSRRIGVVDDLCNEKYAVVRSNIVCCKLWLVPSTVLVGVSIILVIDGLRQSETAIRLPILSDSCNAGNWHISGTKQAASRRTAKERSVELVHIRHADMMIVYSAANSFVIAISIPERCPRNEEADVSWKGRYRMEEHVRLRIH